MGEDSTKVVFRTKTKFDDYQVVEEVYTGRRARLLYSGPLKTAQSGILLDHSEQMLFEYNQRLCELVASLRPSKVLAIGGGVYTLPSYLAKKYPSMTIDVVEPDSELDEIAVNFFNYVAASNLKLYHDDGLNYLRTNHSKYDLIIVDVYGQAHIPKDITSKRFAKLANDHLTVGGLVAMNVISDLKEGSVIANIHHNYSKHFPFYKVYPAINENFYFFATNFIYVLANKPFKLKLKYPSLNLGRLFSR